MPLLCPVATIIRSAAAYQISSGATDNVADNLIAALSDRPTNPNASTTGSEIPVLIRFQREPSLTPGEFIDLLHRSTLAERRPVDQPETIRRMIEHADVILTARADDHLVGVARAITDFGYCTYLSDLAVDVAYQRQGIGRQLIDHVHQAAGLETTMILLAAPAATSYYPHVGFEAHPSCWIRHRQNGATVKPNEDRPNQAGQTD